MAYGLDANGDRITQENGDPIVFAVAEAVETLLGLVGASVMGTLERYVVDGISIDPDTGIVSIDTDLIGELTGYPIIIRCTNAAGTTTVSFTVTTNDARELVAMYATSIMAVIIPIPVATLRGMIGASVMGELQLSDVTEFTAGDEKVTVESLANLVAVDFTAGDTLITVEAA